MNAHEFFENHSIAEINKKTKISPISLRYIKNKEFEKIQRVKFLGFVRIIEKEYKIDLSELIEEYNQATKHTIQNKPEISEEYQENKPYEKYILLIVAFILLFSGGYFLYKNFLQTEKKQSIKQSYIPIETKTKEKNITKKLTKTVNIETNNTKIITAATEEKNLTTEQNQTQENNKTTLPTNIIIQPLKKVWFRAINLDTNKTVEYLTSNPKTLKGPDWYIKFGHGDININYGDKNITPNTKKIVRILFKDGNITYLKKQNRYEK